MASVETALSVRAIEIRHIFISSAHNFKGHHGRPAGSNPIHACHEIECVQSKGIRGDRFFEYKDDFRGQITFFSWDVLEDMRNQLLLPDLDPGALRRNIVMEGVDLNELIGRTFTIQGIRFEGTEECTPCYWMNEAVGSGAEAFMRGQGGLRARILSDGLLKTGAYELRVDPPKGANHARV